MRHITLLLAFAALAANSCSLQLDSQYGLRWEPKIQAGPSSERNQKSSSPPETVLTETAAPSWNSIQPESSEALQTNEGEDNAFGYEEAELARDPNMETSLDDEPQFEPQFFISEQEESVPFNASKGNQSLEPNAAAFVGASLLIILGIFGLIVTTIALIIMGAYGATFVSVLFTLAILALSILLFAIAGQLVKSSK